MADRFEGSNKVAETRGEQSEDESQLFWANSSILVGVTLIAALAPLWLLEWRGSWPRHSADSDYLIPPIQVFILLGIVLVGLGYVGRSRARQAKLPPFR